MSTISDAPLPASIGRVARHDPALAQELTYDFTRLLRAAEALVWAHELLPELIAAPGTLELLERVVARAREVVAVPSIWAVTWEGEIDGAGASYSAVAGDGGSPPAPDQMSSTAIAQAVREGRPVWSDDAASDARFAASQSVLAFGLRSVAAIPIGDRGVLYLHDPERTGRFDPEARSRLTALCRLAGVILQPFTTPEARPVPIVEGLVGQAPAMQEAARAIRAFAPMPWPTLVLGETGTGKEAAARALHALSPHSKGPFVPVNCGAIPEELAESVLFGHERGSFTGADRRKEGVVSRAAGGTLFLDEVGELSARAQVKLLRLLQEGSFERVGGDTLLSFTGRVVAATHQELVGSDAFRDDLYYRLAACVVHMPPLRDRRTDIPALARHLLQEAAGGLPSAPELTLSPGALALLYSRDWPGNVRELGNAIRGAVARALAQGTSELLPEHFTSQVPSEPALQDLAAATKAFQQRRVEAALAASDGNRTEAARRLGVSRQWLHTLLARWAADSEQAP